jgi:hypothetical protein
MFRALICIALLNGVAWGQLFKQDFSSSSALADYVRTTPNNGQWNAIGSSGAGVTVSITSGALQFARGTANVGSFSRTTDFSPTPASLIYRFDLTVSGNSASQTTGAVWQVGAGFGTTNAAEANANVHSRIGLNWTTTAGEFSIRDIGAGTNGGNFSGTQSIMWVMNNFGGTLSYRAPDGTQETVGDDKADVWIGTTKALNEIGAMTTTQVLTDLKFAITAGTATVAIDNFVIDQIPGIPTANASSNVTTTSFDASWSSVSGATGYRLDVATDNTFSSFVLGYNNLDVANFTTHTVSGLSSNTTYYYRVRAYNPAGAGGNSNTISVTSTAVVAEPTTQAHDIAFSSVDATSMTVSWTNGDGSKRLVLAKSGSAVDADPVDGTGYTASATFGSGSELGAGNFVVFSGGGNLVTVSGLIESTTYHFRVYEFNGSGSTADYLTPVATDNPSSRTTAASVSSASDIVAVASSEAATVSSLANYASPLGSSDGVQVWQVTVRDGGGSADADLLPTILNAMTFSQPTTGSTVSDWGAAMLAADLFDGTTHLASGTVGTSTIVFNGLTLTAPDDGSKTISLRISLKNPLPASSDGQSFRLRVTSANVTAASSATSSQFASFSDAASTNGQNVIEVIATKFRFSTQPPVRSAVNTEFSAAVEATDANNNRDLGATMSVTLSASVGILSSATGLVQSLSSGLFTWTDLRTNSPGTGVILTATGTLTTATSSTITMLPVEPTTQASSVNFSAVDGTSMTVNWTNGNGATRIVFAKSGSAIDAHPSDGTSYTADGAFGSGTQIGTGNYVVFIGSGNSVAVNGLSAHTTYHVAVYELNGSGGTENYLTTSPATGNQATGSAIFYSTGSTVLNLLSSWNSNRDGSGSAPVSFTAGDQFTIQHTHSMSTSASWTVSGTGSEVQVESGGTLTAANAVTSQRLKVFSGGTLNINSGITLTVNDGNSGGFDLQVTGTVINAGTISYGAGATGTFLSGGNYNHNFSGTSGNGGTIPSATWEGSSTVEFTATTSGTSNPGGLGQSFGNVTWNCTNQGSAGVNFQGALTTIQGHFTVSSTGSSGVLRLSGNTAFTLRVGGDVHLSGGTLDLTNGTGTASSPHDLVIDGNFNQSGGTFTQTATNHLSLVKFNGNASTFAQSAGTLTSTKMNFEVASGTSLTLSNNLSLASSRALTINGTLDCGTKTVSGAGSVVVNSVAVLKVGSLSSSGAVNGNITASGGMTLNSGSTVAFNGSGAQFAASRTFSNLTLNNSNGLTLLGDVTVDGTLTFTSGNITTVSNKLSLSPTGSVFRTSGHVVGNFQKNVETGPTSRTFEIGDASNYTPVTVTFGNVTVAGDLTAKTTAGDHPNIATSGIDAAKSVNRYWTLTNSGVTFDSYSATFTFVPGDVDGGANTNNFAVQKYDGANWSTTTTGTRTATGIRITGETSFSDFAVGELVLVLPPTTQAHDIVFTNVNAAFMTASWTSGDGSRRLVLAKSGSAVNADPVNGVGYSANAAFGSGSEIGTGNFVVYSGTGDSVTVTGLSPTTRYYFRVYEFNGFGSTSTYLTTTATNNPGSETTLHVVSAASDVIAVASSEAATISSLANTASPLGPTDGAQVWRVTIRDGGESADVDSLPTIVKAMTFSQASIGNTVSNWSNTILAAELFEGSTDVARGTVGASTIAFSGLTATAPDDGSKTLSLRISLKNPLPANSDGQAFAFRVRMADVSVASSATSSQLVSLSDAVSANGQNVIAVIATKLAFTTQPQSGVFVGQNVGPVGVRGRDANDNTDLDFAGAVTLSSSTFSLSSTDSGGLSKNAASGVALWTNCSSSAAGTGTVAADGRGLSQAVSNSITISVDPANILYRSKITGNWGDASTWEASTDDGTTWQNALSSPTSANNTITVRSSHAVTVVEDLTVDQLTVDAGGTMTLNGGLTLTIANGPGTDLSVSGIFNNAGTVAINSGATITCNSGGTYQHNFTGTTGQGGAIPTATWDVASTLEFTAITSGTAVPAGLGQNFGNVTWNCTGQGSTNENVQGALTTIQGDFNIVSTGSTGSLRLSGNTNYTLTVGGNLNLSGGILDLSNGTGTGSTPHDIVINGNYNQTGGTFTQTATNHLSLVKFNGSSSTFTQPGGTLTSTRMNFEVAASKSLALNNTISVATGRSITVNGTLNCGTSAITGAGAFTLASSGMLGIGSPAGVSSSGTTGNIQVTGSRTYDASAGCVYNGSSSQVTGNGLPSSINNLTTRNNGGVTLSQDLSTNGTLTLASGALSMSAHTLTINGGITPTSGSLVGGATSNIVIGGSGGSTTLPAISLNNLTLNRSAGISLGGSVSVAGTITLKSGTLDNSTNTLTLGNSATISRASGSLFAPPTFSTSVNVEYTGTGGVTMGPELPTSTTILNNLTINNSGGVALNADASVESTFTLSNGVFADGGKTLSVKGNLVNNGSHTGTGKIRLAGGSSVHALSGTGSYQNLELDDTQGATLSDADLTVNGTMTFTNGKVMTGTRRVAIAQSGAISGANGATYVIGNLQKSFAAGAQSFTFIIGDATNHTPVSIASLNVTTPGTLTATTIASDHPDISNSGVIPSKSVNRYWTLSAGGGLAFTTYNATFTFVSADVDVGANPNNFIVRRFDGTSWSDVTIGAKTSTSTQVTGVTSFSDFAVGETSIGVPLAFTLTSGNNQSGKVSTALANQFIVTVTDGLNNPVQGATVTFAIISTPNGATGQSLSVTNASTGTDGQASTVLTFGSKTGQYVVTGSTAGLSNITFTATALAGSPASLIISSGNNQQAPIFSQLSPFVVTVRDGNGNPVSGQTVNFALQSSPFNQSGAAVSRQNAVTDANGKASTALILGSKAGQYIVGVTVTNLSGGSVLFLAMALTGTPSQLVKIAGDNQSSSANTTLSSPLAVVAMDAGGNPVQGMSVTFAIATVPTGATGQSVSVPNATTDANGRATTVLTLGNKAGTYIVTATATGLTGSLVTFTATAMVGAAAAIALTSGDNQTGVISTALANPLVVTVTDAGGNPIQGSSVTFAIAVSPAGARGQSLSVTGTTTNASGQASTVLTLGNKTGTYTVTATSGSLSGSLVTFTATATVGAAATIALTSGNNQTGIISTALANTFVVTVTDVGGNPVQGTSVSFAIASTPSGATGQSLNPTNATIGVNGQTATTLTLGNKIGTYTVTANSTGLTGSPMTFTSTAIAGPATAIAVTSGNNQIGIISTTLANPFVVTVTDVGGNPVQGMSVTFAIASTPSGATGQSLSATSTTTSGVGQALTVLTLGSMAGNYTATATSGSLTGSPVGFSAIATNPVPTLLSTIPNRAGRGSRINVTITGTNFLANVTTVSFGADITVNSQSVTSSTQIAANISTSSAAVAGGRDVTVTNAGPGGGTSTIIGGFTIDTSPPTSVESIAGVIPEGYLLHTPYPNPFNPSTRVRFEVPEESKVKVVVFNLLGVQVDELVNETMPTGVYSVVWNAGRLPSGSYIVRFQAQSSNSWKQVDSSTRVMLLK